MRRLQPREYTMLGVLAVALVVALWINRGGGFGVGGDADDIEEFDRGEPPRIAMSRLEPTEASFNPQDRNPFGYYTPPRQAPVRQAAPVRQPPPPPPRVEKAPQPVQPQKEIPKAPTLRPPTPNFKYIGKMGPPSALIAALETTGDDIVLAREGDVVQEDFRLLRFTYDSIVLGYTDERFKDETTEMTQQVQRR